MHISHIHMHTHIAILRSSCDKYRYTPYPVYDLLRIQVLENATSTHCHHFSRL